MLNTKGRFNKNGEIVLQQGLRSKSKTQNDGNLPTSPSNIRIEFSVTIDLNDLISGIDGFVWATKNIRQAEIICNSIKVQHIELESFKVEVENTIFHLLRVSDKNDVNQVIDFIQNDNSGLRLKPDWSYPDGEPNQSFDQWTNH